MGGVKPNRKVTRHFRSAYLYVSAICNLDSAGPIHALAQAGGSRLESRLANCSQSSNDDNSEAIS